MLYADQWAFRTLHTNCNELSLALHRCARGECLSKPTSALVGTPLAHAQWLRRLRDVPYTDHAFTTVCVW